MNIKLEGTKFVYTEHDKEKVLLDCSDFLSNKSRVPLQAEGVNVLDLLVGLAEKERSYGSEWVKPALLIDILVISRLIQAARPFHVLEYGCGEGRLSVHLAEILGLFCENSSLICLSDEVDAKWIKWKEKISEVKKPPKLSFLFGNYESIPLQKNSFDIILINGTEEYPDPYQLLLYISQLLTKEGILLCYFNHASLLETTFKLLFEETDEYKIASSLKIILGKAINQNWEENEHNFEKQVQLHLQQADNLQKSKDVKRSDLADIIKILQQDAKTASLLGMANLKICLLEQKQQLIEFLLSF